MKLYLELSAEWVVHYHCHKGTTTSYFIYEMDQFVIDSATKKVVYEGQKPLQLLSDLKMYSSEGEWTFYAPTGIGMQCVCISLCM